MSSPNNLPPEVTPIVNALLPGIRDALGDNIVGIYLRGSLALGGFDPETSDVDLLVVTETPVSDREFDALAVVHDRLPARENMFDRSYEVSYIDRGSLRRFGDDERIHPTIGADWPFARSHHPDNFVVERWVTREHGITLGGPDPKTLIDPISPDDLRTAVANEFRRHMIWVKANDPPEWLGTRNYQAFAIETMCRGLYTLKTGTITIKTRAVGWALEALPEPWRSLVAWSREHHADKTSDPTKMPEVMRFIRWAAESANVTG